MCKTWSHCNLSTLLGCVSGRAGHSGEAITFFTESDAGKLRGVARLAAEAGSEVPDWMLHMAKQKKKKKRNGVRRVSGVIIMLRAFDSLNICKQPFLVRGYVFELNRLQFHRVV